MLPTPFEAHLEVTKTLVAMVVTALIAGGGLVFAWNARGSAQATGWSSDSMVRLGIGAALFFVMAAVSFKSYRTYDQSRSGPIVLIDDTGVLDRRLGQTPIPWRAIHSAEIKDISNARMIRAANDDKRDKPQVMGVVLQVENAAQYLDGDGFLGASAKTLGQATGYEQLNISPEGLTATAEQILAAVQSYLAVRRD